MAITCNPQQLMLVKQLYEDARALSARNDELSLTKAIILLDLSVDNLLNQIVRDCSLPNPSSGRNDAKWHDNWSNAHSALKNIGINLIHRRELASLHDIQNLTQHNGTIPTQNEVQRYLVPAFNMIQKVFNDLYNRDFQNFTLWDLIENQNLRRLLIDSEFALSRGKPEICICGCSIVHNRLIETVRSYTKKHRFDSPFGDFTKLNSGKFASSPLAFNTYGEETVRLASVVREELADLKKEILEEIKFLEHEIVTVGIGMPVMEARKFQSIVDRISYRHDKHNDVVEVYVTDYDARDIDLLESARFTLNYLSRLIRLVDDSYPEITQNFHFGRMLNDFEFWKEIEPPVGDQS